MSKVILINNSKLGEGFLESKFLHNGQDEFYFRNQQVNKKNWRNLKPSEINLLIKNGNTASSWDDVLVTEPFNPSFILRSSFYGLVRIGKIEEGILKYHDFALNQGIYDSVIISSDIGDNCAINKCHYISYYIVKDRVILHQIDELQTTNHAKFGVGIVKEGEDEEVRVSVDIMNESGGRKIYPFVSMTCADAYLWGSYRADTRLMKRFLEFTNATMSSERGWYGIIESDCVIKSCRIVKDVYFGECVYAKGSNKLKNLTISSSEDMPSQIGEGVELVNGIIGEGCHIFYGCKAVRFVMMDKTSLKYGARLINSVLGENSTISCCEVLNNLVFPSHEQHHNNSFLIASTIQGLSNMAAGANIGSNHNSRGADGEIVAQRGFWPALSSTLKHNCKFAPYTLIAKGNYPSELNITFPFSLISGENDVRVIMPAYWWMYNLYALERNSFKVKDRDNRTVIKQIVENNYLAPDTALSIIEARRTLRLLVAKAYYKDEKNEKKLRQLGATLLNSDKKIVDKLKVVSRECENSNTPVKILKPYEAYHSYKEMLIYYGAKQVSSWCYKNNCSLSQMQKDITSNLKSWSNIGGQIVLEENVDKLRSDINSGKINSWQAVHQVYKAWDSNYEKEKTANALGVLKDCFKVDYIDKLSWAKIKENAIKTRGYIEKQVFETRVKDYNNHFRSITFRDNKERDIVLGAVEENSFIIESKNVTKDLILKLESVKL
jgi:NDP-sugar pyrophosphorylase family protein